MTNFIDMSQRFHNRALMIDDETIDVLKRSTMSEAIQIEDLSEKTAVMWSEVRSGQYKPYAVIEGNIAVIPVNGTLYHKVDWAGYSYTGYEWIRNLVAFAKNDDDIAGVVMDYRTGGGEVDGAFETAADIRDLANEKPVLGLAGNHAYSAGYLLLSASSKINVPQTGGVGSIGVVTSHMDVSDAMTEAGYKLTFIYKGKHKVDGNSYEPLPKAVKARVDAKLDVPYNLFVEAVADYRSIDSQIVRDTEAATFNATEALELGLVDSVLSSDDAIAGFVAEINGKNRSKIMSVANANAEHTTTSAANGNESANVVEVQKAAVAAAREEGIKAGADSERGRIMGILKSDEAKERNAMALVLCEKGMSVEVAKEILAASPASAPAATTTAATTTVGRNDFADAMDKSNNPEVSASADESSSQLRPAQKALAALTAATGEKFALK